MVVLHVYPIFWKEKLQCPKKMYQEIAIEFPPYGRTKRCKFYPVSVFDPPDPGLIANPSFLSEI